MDKIENSDWKRLLGKWQTQGSILKKGQTESTIIGTDSYELILGGHFILHKANVLMGNAKSETHEVIVLISPEEVEMRYYNSDGESGLMSGFLNGNVIKIEGDNLRFTGHISDDNTAIAGTWQQLSENNDWSDFLEMKFSK